MTSPTPYQLLPRLSDEEYSALRDDIAANGVRVPIDVDEDGTILDGHHRAWITADLGIDCPRRLVADLTDEQKRTHAVAVNVHRRSLSREQRRDLVARLRWDGMSTPQIAKAVGTNQSTVVRDLQGMQAHNLPDRVVGADGKTYSATRPQPPAAPMDDPFVWVEPESEPVQDQDDLLTHAPMETVAPTVEAPAWTDSEKDLYKRLTDGETVVVSLRGEHARLIEWADERGLFVRIDRRSAWGNPFEMPADGDRDTVIGNYRDHYLPHKPSLLERLPELRGKALGCWCAPEPCHGDVLKAGAEQP